MGNCPKTCLCGYGGGKCNKCVLDSDVDCNIATTETINTEATTMATTTETATTYTEVSTTDCEGTAGYCSISPSCPCYNGNRHIIECMCMIIT